MPVFGPDKPWEGKGARARAGVFSDGVWFDPWDQLFKAWYWSGAISEMPLRYATCYTVSRDGIAWEKPPLDVVPGTNIVLRDEEGYARNSGTVWLDQFEKDAAKRFKMFRVVQQDNLGAKGITTFSDTVLRRTASTGSSSRTPPTPGIAARSSTMRIATCGSRDCVKAARS